MKVILNVELDSKLQQLLTNPQQVLKQETKKALNDALDLIYQEAKIKHRFKSRTGNLENAIYKMINSSTVNEVSGEIGIDDRKAPYGKFVHNGTKPHIIMARKAKFLAFMIGNRLVFAKKVNHPGTKPDEFIYNAGKIQGNKVKDILTNNMKVALGAR